MTQTPTQNLLNVKQLAQWLGVSAATIYRIRSTGETDQLPPSVTVGTAPRWRPEAVTAWLEEQEGKEHAA